MTRPPPHERPAASELSGKRQPMSVAGKPADVCPHCGAGLLVDGVNRTDHEIVRYVVCRNRNCGKRFLSHQPPAKILREVGNSADGNQKLTLHREAV